MASPNTRILITIIDPFKNQVVFRLLPKDAWNPPGGIFEPLGTYEFFIHPDGHIYFFDGDVKTKSFILKRWVNDWWKELGFDKQEVGIVNDNRVRLRSEPSTNGTIVGHVYELEHALIEERSKEQQTINGQTAYWYKVRLWDGRSGWVFGAFVDIQN